MDMEAQIVSTLREELERQATQGDRLTVQSGSHASLALEGEIDLEALAMAVAGSLAGGP